MRSRGFLLQWGLNVKATRLQSCNGVSSIRHDIGSHHIWCLIACQEGNHISDLLGSPEPSKKWQQGFESMDNLGDITVNYPAENNCGFLPFHRLLFHKSINSLNSLHLTRTRVDNALCMAAQKYTSDRHRPNTCEDTLQYIRGACMFSQWNPS